MNYKTGNLYYSFPQDKITVDSINLTVQANLNLLKQDLLEELEPFRDLVIQNPDNSYTINAEKQISESSLDALKEIYKRKFKEYEEDGKNPDSIIESQFLNNLFRNYTSVFKASLGTTNDQILADIQNLKKTEENLGKINYNEYQRIGINYYDNINKIHESLINGLEEHTDLIVNQNKDEELKIKLYSLMNNNLDNLSNIFKEKSESLQAKYKKILENIKMNIKLEEQSLKDVSSNFKYLNSGFKLHNYSLTDYYFLQKVLQDNYGGKFTIISNLLNQYGYIDKRRALEACSKLNKTSGNTYDISNILNKFYFKFENHIINFKYRTILKHNIEHDSIDNLLKTIDQYEKYPASNLNMENINILKLYAVIYMVNERIYDDYLNFKNYKI